MKRNTRKNKMKENKKYPYKKGGRNRTSKLVLTILFSFIFMFSIANVSAFLSVGHYKQLTNQTNYSGTIVIGKHLFLFFGKSSPEVDYTLTSNTVSVINGEATGTATLYTDGVLFSGKKFKGGEVKNSKIYIWVNQTKQVEVPDYKQECEIDYSNSTNGTQICKQIKIGSHNKTVDNFHWQVYNKEKLPAGNYTWKLTGQRKPNQAIDWILTSGIGNKNLNEWAWWNNSWNYRQLITINYSDSVNLSSYWVNFTYSPPTGHFANDFSDLRLVNYDATDEFVWKYSAKNSTSIDVWVFTDSSTQNITNGQIKFYAYYNTSTPVSHGWTTGFYYGDTFTNVTSTDWTTGLTTAGTYTLDATTSSLKYTGNGAGTGSSMYHNLPSEVSGWEDITINFNATWGGSINNDGSYYFAGITATGADPSDTWIGYFLNGKTSNYGTSDLSNVWAANINGAYQDVGATISNTWIDGKVIQTGNSNSSSVARTQRLIWGGDMTTGDITETTSSYQFTTSPACHISSDDRYSGQTTMTSWLLISHGNGTQTGYSVGAEISKVMQFSITYPQNITYSENVSTISYTSSGVLPDYCWYSRDGGTTNSSLFVGGNNLTNIYSVSGSNTWWLYCNDSSNNNASDSITFTENKLWNNSGYPTLDKEFRVNEFINVSGNNFTLGGNPYTLQGVNSYYLVDYATNHTYDDDGNEINNSRDAVNEILGEAHDLGINVIRTWANMQGGNDTYWIINNSGGHYNLFEVGVPGNYSNQTLEALDWLISEAGKKDIRLQLVLINNWDDYGGMRWYAQESPTTDKTYQWINDTSDPNYWLFHDQFYNDTNTMTYYKNYVNMLLNRNNTVTGRLYKDDPTIFAWLLANEPRAKSDGDGSQELIKTWTTNMTAYIKSIDSNHLVGLGIEGWGDPFDGTSFVDDQNGTGVDFATFELHPDQWDWFAQRSENITDLGWQTGGVNSTSTVDWWTNGTQESYNNRYEGSYIPNYNPSLARHAYDNWVKQNVLWANDLGLPVLMQEVAMPTSSNDSIKDRFFQQAIHTFFSNGGDGFIYWNLNHDNYYYSTTPDGVMDDGYSFYVSDDPTLKAKSQSVIDAFNFTKYDNNGGSWVVSLNNYAYDFITNVGWANDINIINSTLFLNISDGTTWRQEQKSNNSVIVVNTNNAINKQFNNNDTEFYWYTVVYANDGTTLTSPSTYERIVPTINVYSLDEDVYNYLPENFNMTLNFTIVDDYLDTCWYNYNNTNTIFSCSNDVNGVTYLNYESGDDSLTIYANNTYGLIGIKNVAWTTKIAESSREVSSQSYQTQNEDYKINLIANSSLTDVKLDYNGTEYSTTQSGTEYSINLVIPLNYVGNNSVRWKFTYAGDTIYSNYSYQMVNDTQFGLCNSSLTVKYLNISFKDETDDSVINATIPTSTFIYYLGNGTVTRTYTYINTTANYDYTFCATPSSKTFHIDPYIQYKNGASYPQRIYDTTVSDYTNSTTNLTLYLLPSTNGIYVTFQVINSANQVLSGVDVTATRTISGSSVMVGHGTTGADGGVTFWLNPDFVHTFIFNKTGYSDYETSFAPTQSAYTITMSSGETITSSHSKGIVKSILPTNTSLENDTTYTFEFNLTSSYWEITEYGFNLRLNNGTIITGGSTSVEGTQLTKQYDTNNQTRIYLDYYWLINGTYTNGTRMWNVYNTDNTQWSIKVFFTDTKNYFNSGFFGIDNFGRYLLIFIVIFFTIGIMSYKYGLTSPLTISLATFLIIFFFDVVVNIIPAVVNISGNEVPYLLTFLSGLIFVIMVIKEVSK